MFDIYYTSAVVLFMTIALVKEVQKPSLILITTLLALHLGGIITLKEAFSGFSNQGMLAVGALFIVAYALQSSTALDSSIEKILGKKADNTIYFRFMLPIACASGFLNNTPLVASLLPVIKRWCKKHGLSASKFLIPLSYATIIGGTCTLIGTSTNLVVHGMMLDHGLNGFSFFELSKAALPLALVTIAYFALIGHRFLPERKDSLSQFTESLREFVIEVSVQKDYPYLGNTVHDANLRHLKGLFLFQIMRENKEITPVSPDERILLGDKLFFTGLPETIYDLLHTPGLRLIEDSEYDIKNLDSDKHGTFEAVLSNSSPLIGQTVKECNFRTKYDAVILGIHRNGHRIIKKVGDIELKPNDTLFILAKRDFSQKWYASTDFSLVSNSISRYSKPKKQGNLALLLMLAMIGSVTFGLTSSMLLAASITAGIMIFTNIISAGDAQKAIDFDVLLIIACAFGIGKGIENSGVAELLATHMINAVSQWGIIGIIAGIFFITSIYTEIITNNAAAALIFPIVLSIAEKMQIDPLPLMVTLAIAASASFATPIGYQTNLMVYNPGGYKFSDFLKTGSIMNLLSGIIVTIMVYLVYFRGI
ncbi:SLC13 family permease [Prosthecochloris sp.]|uniref:SLC13 family permease n=1 Tax=Prosthecochloris sp. TaxID=290513 RepID=UPI00257951B6|nr:SLC13 family permease [Prosthecochloris sp.]